MKLKVLGSSSSGNCYILESDTEALIIEAGISFMEVKKTLNFNVRKIVGVICSHRHLDHSKYIAEYENAGIRVWKPYFDNDAGYEIETKYFGKKFTVRDFDLVHDVDCLGFHIQHPDIGSLVYATDTEYIKYRFRNINHILVEANYSDDLIDNEAVNREHVLRGHMSLQTALDFISTNDTVNLRTVCLLHLSKSNSDSDLFLKKARETVKYGADCYIAEKGLEISLDLVPF